MDIVECLRQKIYQVMTRFLSCLYGSELGEIMQKQLIYIEILLLVSSNPLYGITFKYLI